MVTFNNILEIFLNWKDKYFIRRFSLHNPLIIPETNLILMKMNQKEILLKEMLKRVGDRLDEEIVAEKVNQFIKYGTVFLLFEVMNLRKEIETIKEEIPAA